MAAAAGMRAGPVIAGAGLAAGIALLLALPIVGLTTVEGQYHLYIQPHLGQVGLIGLGVFIACLAIAGFRAYRTLAIDMNAVAPVPEVATTDRNLGKWLGWALLGGVVALPLFASSDYVSLGTEVLIYVMLGWGLNIVVGLAGLLDLGYVAFYGVGAYTVGLLSSDFGWSFWECLPVAGLAAGCFGILLGFPVLRLRGDYLAIVTLGFGEIIRLVLLNWARVTGGPNGINDMPRPTFFGLPLTAFAGGHTTFDDFFHIAYRPGESGIFLYFVALALALATNLLALRLRRLPVGRAWEALREDEIACRAVGINPTSLKLSAFATGAMIGGLAGALFAAWVNFISPESFTFTESAMILASVVLGGRGSQLGVAIAALLIVTFPEFARPLASYRMVIFGAAMVAVMVMRPRGLVTSRRPTLRLNSIRTSAAESRAG